MNIGKNNCMALDTLEASISNSCLQTRTQDQSQAMKAFMNGGVIFIIMPTVLVYSSKSMSRCWYLAPLEAAAVELVEVLYYMTLTHGTKKCFNSYHSSWVGWLAGDEVYTG